MRYATLSHFFKLVLYIPYKKQPLKLFTQFGTDQPYWLTAYIAESVLQHRCPQQQRSHISVSFWFPAKLQEWTMPSTIGMSIS